MSTQEQTTEEAPGEVISPSGVAATDPFLWIELSLSEADALYGWLMKPAQDGSTALDDPLVSRALAKVREASDSVRAAVNIRNDLRDAGLATDHLSDDELRELAQKLTQSSTRGPVG
jgi:hypothetical protein